MLQNVSLSGPTLDYRNRDKGRNREQDHSQRDRYQPQPHNGNEQRADLKFKDAWRDFKANKSDRSQQARQTSNREELTSDFPGRTGVDPNFLGVPFQLPKIDASVADQVAELIGKPGETELKYGNFSIVMNGVRRQPFYTVVNIDGPKVVDVPRDGDWTIDSRIRRDQQLGNEAYKNNDIDKGHQVRRRDAGWGPNAHRSANDTFAYTNASLQHAALNQKEWLELENHVLDQVKAKGMKATVLTGPVMKDNDPKWDNKGKMEPTQMPQEFWKVVVWNDPQDGLKGAAFVLSQTDFVNPGGLFKSSFEEGRFGVYQVPIDQLEKMTRLDFGDMADSKKSAKEILDPTDARVLR